MPFTDDDLLHFAADGAPPLPPGQEGHVAHDGARIWYRDHGAGPAVILLHGGLGHGGNWGHQVPALVDAGYRALVIDSRGHGRSTRDDRPYRYDRMAADVLAVMDHLRIGQAQFVGWSDGACVSLIFAKAHPERTASVFFFACNMDGSGVKEIDEENPLLGRCFGRHKQDYQALSATPADFGAFVAAVTAMMQSQPAWSAEDLRAVRVPVSIVLGEKDEFIKAAHADYLAATIPGATRLTLKGVSHFAPLQRPAAFNQALLDFLELHQPKVKA